MKIRINVVIVVVCAETNLSLKFTKEFIPNNDLTNAQNAAVVLLKSVISTNISKIFTMDQMIWLVGKIFAKYVG